MSLPILFIALSAVGALLGFAISFPAFKQVFAVDAIDVKQRALVLEAMLMPELVYVILVFLLLNMQVDMTSISEDVLLYGTGVFGVAGLIAGVLKGKNLQVGFPKFELGQQQFVKMILINAAAEVLSVLGLVFVVLTLFNGKLPWN